MVKQSTFLWFNNQAEEAAKFYTSVFKDSSISKTVVVPGGGPEGNDTVQLVEFQINGQSFTAFNGGPYFTFNEAISFAIHCDTQEELDNYWSTLISGGGQESQCGWLKDKYGLSWQIIPTILPQLMSKGDQSRNKAMMTAIRSMVKLDIAQLEKAYNS
jgi:predicted 3-demethylubiquinone-9 3-methyltransferase (glyoxalase superfamily)